MIKFNNQIGKTMSEAEEFLKDNYDEDGVINELVEALEEAGVEEVIDPNKGFAIFTFSDESVIVVDDGWAGVIQ